MAALELRPLSLGELLDRTFFMYRRHFLTFVGIAAIPYALFLSVALLVGLVIYAIPGRGSLPFSAQVAGGIVGVLLLVVILFGVSAAFLYSAGASVFAVSEIYAGRRPTIQESYRLVRGKAGVIFGVVTITGLILIAGFIALIIPGLYLMCRVPVATAAALIEDQGPGDAIRRSFDLTKNFAGRAALIYMLALALTYGVGLMIQIPFFMLLAVSARQTHLAILWTVLAQTGNILGGILVAPVHSIAFALFYYDLRVRKEAFDLQMMMQAVGVDPAAPPITGGVPSMFGRDAS